jgi:hypothetical protein
VSDDRPGQSSQAEPTVEPPRSARLVLLFGVLTGLASVVSIPFVAPDQFMLASDVYYYAADALLSEGDIYAVTPPDRSGYHYIYPPVVVFTFVPHVLLDGPAAAYVLQTVLNAAFAVGIAIFLWRALSRRNVALGRVDGVLLVAFAFVSAYSAITVVNGQVTLWLGFAVAAGLDALDRNRDTLAGLAFAAAALVKVFPAALGLWLLRRRAYRGVAAAIALGLLGLLVGLLALGPEVTETYFTEVLTGRYDGFDGAPDPTQTRGGAQRQVAAILSLGPPYVTPLAGAVLAPALGYLYLDLGSDMRRQAAVLGTILVTLLFFPLQRLYMILFVFPLVVLLYRLPSGRPRRLLVLGTLVSSVRISFPVAESTLEALPLPTALESSLLAVVTRLFEVILPPTLGMWLLLGACLLVHRTEP